MQKDIVRISNKEVFTDTLIISNMLEIPHRDLLRTIEKIIVFNNNNALLSTLKFPQKFKECSFQNKMNRTYKMYELNEQAYMKLAMHLKGYQKAEIVQDAIIEAFSLMKEVVLNQQNASWLNARKQSKLTRKIETDVIKEFVEYATKQGSKSAKMYYMNITKMTNKALELLVQVKSGNKLRGLSSIMELGFIQVIDNRAMQAIEYGMKQKLHYKEIYIIAKDEVNTLADSLNFNRKSII